MTPGSLKTKPRPLVAVFAQAPRSMNAGFFHCDNKIRPSRGRAKRRPGFPLLQSEISHSLAPPPGVIYNRRQLNYQGARPCPGLSITTMTR